MNNKVYVFDACAFIEAAHQYNIKKNKKSSSNGDPFLIATAMCENGNAVIVTNENTTKEFGIPKISSKYNINSINLRQFIEENFD